MVESLKEARKLFCAYFPLITVLVLGISSHPTVLRECKMPTNKKDTLKLPGKHSELAQYFSFDDPEPLFLDQREIGHGSFGAVFYVSGHTVMFIML